jgi:hypothetical protein
VFLDPNPTGGTVAVDPTVVPTVMVDTNFAFVAGSYYTIVHIGDSRAGSAVTQKFWTINDALPTQSTAVVAFRIINVAPVQGAVDVYVRPDGVTPLSGALTAWSRCSGRSGPLIRLGRIDPDRVHFRCYGSQSEGLDSVRHAGRGVLRGRAAAADDELVDLTRSAFESNR